jgi:Xaa-Pro aminopeptidase
MDYEKRIINLKNILREENLSAIVVTSWENLWYLTGIEHLYRQIRSAGQMALVIPADGDIVFIPTQGFSHAITVEHPAVKHVLPYSEDAEIYPFKNRWQRVAEAIDSFKFADGRIGLEIGTLTVPNHNDLLSEVTDNPLVPADFILNNLRAIKDDEELDRMRRAARLTDIILDEVMHRYLSPGITEWDEWELACRIRERALLNNIEVAFTQVFSGYRNNFQNIESSSKKIEEHEIVLVDYGINFRGYCTDITRAYSLGEPTQKQVDTCKIVADILLGAIEMMKPGVLTGEVDEYVKNSFNRRGLSELWRHRTGHGMGIQFCEWPYLASPEKTEIKPNMVFAVEPGIYYPDFSIRLEDNVIVHSDGCENMTQTPREIIVV